MTETGEGLTGWAFLDWAVELLEGVEASPEQRAWCRHYPLSAQEPGQEALERDLRALEDQSRRLGLTIANYQRAMEVRGLEAGEMDRAAAESLPRLDVLACLTWHFRRDHFSEGSLIRESVAEGALLRLFRRLRELQRWPGIATTLGELFRDRCGGIPTAPGVYRVLAPEGVPIRFLDRTEGPAPWYPAEELEERYRTCRDREILYIGKADGRRGLRQRVWQYVRYGWGGGTVHRGGRAIWQIPDADLLLLEYDCCPDCEARERALLEDYLRENGTLPLANRRR